MPHVRSLASLSFSNEQDTLFHFSDINISNLARMFPVTVRTLRPGSHDP